MNEQFNQVPQEPVAPAAPAAPQKNGMATAGMVLGIIGAVFGVIAILAPGMALLAFHVIAMILGVLALIFGVVGLLKKVAVGKGKAIAAIILAVVCIFSFFYAPAALEASVNNALEEAFGKGADLNELEDAFSELEDALADIDLDSIS